MQASSYSEIHYHNPVDLSNQFINELISNNFSVQHTQKVQNYANQLFKKKLNAIEVGDKIIQKFKNDKKIHKELLHFDLQLGQVKQRGDDKPLLLSNNIERLKKWTNYGFAPELFYKNADFVDFLFDSFLGSQMKVTRSSELKEIEGEPALLVEGTWTKASAVLEQFEIKLDPVHQEKFIFKKGTDQVYTYIDTGQGLVPFHPYQEGLKTPMSKLSVEEYQKVLGSAQQFVRETDTPVDREEKQPQRTCILQIVSSRVNQDKKYGFLTKNIFNMTNRRHPWMRLIELDEKGEGAHVYSVGFGWAGMPNLPLQTILGRFRSIDQWEYQAGERIVTNIAITPEELKKLQEFPEQFMEKNGSAGFNLMTQNCSVAVREGIGKATGIHVPTEIGFDDFVLRLSPDFFSHAIRKMSNGIEKGESLAGKVTPVFIRRSYVAVMNKISAFFEALMAVQLSILGILIGSAYVSKRGKKLRDANENLSSPVGHFHYWYDYSLHKGNLPGVLQEWQDKQASTVVYKQGNKGFAIVPL